MNKNPLCYSNMKKKNTSIREERVESQFWMDLPPPFLISHKLQDATRKPEALHLPHPST